MGWTTHTFKTLRELSEKFSQPGKSAKIMDFGSQDIVITSSGHFDELLEALSSLGSPWRRDGVSFPAVLPVRELLEDSNVDYYCLDIDDRPRTIDVDLNVGDFDPCYKGFFDLVFNCGTTEHVINPVTAFFTIHQMCRTGGGIYHHTPLFGMGNHGFINFTPKFWHTVLWMNDYEVLRGACHPIDETKLDSGNIYMDHLDFISGLSKVRNTSHLIELVFVKRHPYCFIPPIDIWPEMGRARLISMVTSACWAYHGSRALTLAELEESVTHFVDRMGI